MTSKYWRRGWRKIPGFENYRVLKDGRIYSLNADRFLVQPYNVKFYKRMDFYVNGERVRVFVHRAVATCFRKNPDPKTKIEVNHLDWDKENNNSWNLEWCTPSENMKHAKQKFYGKKIKNYSHEAAKTAAGTLF
jgi:hypothetical protein